MSNNLDEEFIHFSTKDVYGITFIYEVINFPFLIDALIEALNHPVPV